MAKTMLLHSILETLTQKLDLSEPTAAGKQSTPRPETVQEQPSFPDSIKEVRIPASEATFKAAAQAKGMKRIELEIAAAAGLLRPMSPEPPPELNQSSKQGFDELLRTVEELRKPGRSHNLDLFE